MIAKNVAPNDTYVDKLGCAMPQDTLLQRRVLVRYSSASRIVLGSMGCLLVGGAFGGSLGTSFKSRSLVQETTSHWLHCSLWARCTRNRPGLLQYELDQFSFKGIRSRVHSTGQSQQQLLHRQHHRRTRCFPVHICLPGYRAINEARRNPSKLSLSRIQA